MNVPPQLKPVTAFVKRAEELDKDTLNPDSKIVAYFCRRYAVEKGMKLNDRSPEVSSFLMTLMSKLEKDTANIPTSTEERKTICENFAYDIFSKADEEDRQGAATKSTAQTFYAAGSFFDVLEVFGELSSDSQEKRRYSKFKAAEIIKAIKAGVRPTPGAPGEEQSQEGVGIGFGAVSSIDASSESSIIYSIPPAPTATPQPIMYIPPAPFTQPTSPPVIPTAPPSSNHHFYSQPPAYPLSPPDSTSAYSFPAPAPYSQYSPSAPPPVTYGSALPIAAPGQTHTTAPAAPLSISSPRKPSPTSYSDPRVKDAIECCNFAISSLKHNEITLAKERLQEALRRLG